MSPTHAFTIRTKIRAVVWGLFAAVIVVASLSGATSFADTSGTSSDAVVAAASDDAASGGSSKVTIDPSISTPQLACNTSYNMRVTTNGPCRDRYMDNPHDLLPAWRWASASSLYSNLGMSDAFNGAQAFSFLAGVCFTIASWAWQLLIMLTSYALGMDLVNSAGERINDGFVAMTSSLTSAGVIWVIIFAVIFVAARAALKGDLPKIVSIILALVVPIAAMQALATAASSNDAVIPRGSPAWIAQRGTDFTTQMGASLTHGFGIANPNFEFSTLGDDAAPNCNAYIGAMYDQYFGFAAADASSAYGDPLGGIDAVSDALRNGDQDAYNRAFADIRERTWAQRVGTASTLSLASVSLLFDRAFYSNWAVAQYGEADQAHRVACRQLESNAGIPMDEQIELARIANGPRVSPGTHPIAAGAFYFGGGDKDREAQALAWAACEYNPANSTWSVKPGWYMITKGETTTEHCSNYFTLGGPGESEWKSLELRWGSRDSLRDSMNMPQDVWDGILTAAAEGGTDMTADPATLQADTGRAENVVDSYWGHNHNQRFLLGLITMITAIIYAWSIGAIAVGTIIAQAGLVIALMLLPVTLLLLAIPSARGRSDAGTRMLKMTVGFLGAKLVLVVTMALLLQIILLLETVLASSGSGLSMYMHALIPLAGLFLIRKIAKTLGFGNITSASGALGLATGAAASLNGTHALKGTTGAFNQASDRLGLGKAKAGAKALGRRHRGTAAKWGAKGALVAATGGLGLAGLGAARAAKSDAAKLAAERLGLTHAKRQLFGGVDADGNATYGLASRLTSFAGLAGLAAGSRFAPISALGTSRAAKWAADMSRRTSSRAGHAELAARQMAARRATRAAVGSMGHRERAEVTRAAAVGELEGMRRRAQVRRDESGDPILHEGQPVYGWRDSNGELIDSADGAAEVLLEPVRSLTPELAIAAAAASMDARGLKASQVAVSSLGAGVTLIPKVGGLVEGKRFEHTVELARDGANYMSDLLKAIPAHLNEDGKVHYLQEMSLALGFVDPDTGGSVDIPAMFGIDLGSAAGQAELAAHLEGRESKFDVIPEFTLDATTHQAIIARSSEVSRRSSAMLSETRVEARDAVRAAITESLTRVRDAQSEASAGKIEVQAIQAALRKTLDQKVALAAKVDRVQAAVDNVPDGVDPAEHTAKVTAEVSELNARLAEADAAYLSHKNQLEEVVNRVAEAAELAQVEAYALNEQNEILRALKDKGTLADIADRRDSWTKYDMPAIREDAQRRQDVAVGRFMDSLNKAGVDPRDGQVELNRAMQEVATMMTGFDRALQATVNRSAGLHADAAARLDVSASDMSRAARRWSGPVATQRSVTIIDNNSVAVADD